IALVGVEGYPVEIESDIENGLPCLFLVGLPDTALREARDRIRAAIINSREQWPQRRITVGLSPASLPKRGSGFDLGIALSILAAAGTIPASALDGVAFLGGLGVDGRVRPVPGVLPAMGARGGGRVRRGGGGARGGGGSGTGAGGGRGAKPDRLAGVAARRSGPGTTGAGRRGTGRGGRRGTDRAGRRGITGAGPHGTGRDPRRGPGAAVRRPG